VSDAASLLVPALRWDAGYGFRHLADFIDDALDAGVGGFLVLGGTREAVAELLANLHARSRLPLLIATDAERGAGQQFEGCTGLPPLGALTALGDPDVLRRAARITARELKALGANWALAPVCDLDVPPRNPIVGTRAAAGDPERAGALLAEWIDACQAEGVLACAKHFPGHGGADGDSHRALAVTRKSAEWLWRDELAPFRHAVEAGVASVMTAHVAYPSLDAGGSPATLSRPMLADLLRGQLGFEGLVVSDSLEMDGVLSAGSESQVAVRAIVAGCDVLLAIADPQGVAAHLERAMRDGVLSEARVREAVERRAQWALWARPVTEPRTVTLDDLMWARQVADRAVCVIRGNSPRFAEAVEMVLVDDDSGGQSTVPERAHLAATFQALGVDAPVVAEPTPRTRVPVLIAAFDDVVAWKGRTGFSDASRATIERTLSIAKAQRRDACVVLFAHPANAEEFPGAANVVCAWGGERPMQEAAARVLVRGGL
jgi:beta-glucosidase-like glycosyl hydrolase